MSEMPECPKRFKGEARKEWDRMVKVLSEHGMLKEIDLTALAAYCRAWARWLRAERKLSTGGRPIRK